MARVRHIFRWDLDKTYLKTEFDTVRDLVRTARATAEERQNIPGSAALIRSIRESAPDNLIYFISGSPEQMRSVIERKFSLDGFSPDGFILKPTVSNLLRGRFRAVREQIPYKLGALLRGRAEAPIGSRETLIGDDAESDAFVYSLYADLVAGIVRAKTLEEILKRTGAYPDQVRRIAHELSAVVHEPAVTRILIHLDQLTPPAAFQSFFPRVVPIYNHLQTAIVLYLDGSIGLESVRAVAEELVSAFGFDAQRLANSAEDILRRQRIHRPADALDRFVADLGALGPPKAPGPADEVLARITERVVHLSRRPAPRSGGSAPAQPLDYLGLLDVEVERREETRRAKKAGVVRAEISEATGGEEPASEAEPATEG